MFWLSSALVALFRHCCVKTHIHHHSGPNHTTMWQPHDDHNNLPSLDGKAGTQLYTRVWPTAPTGGPPYFQISHERESAVNRARNACYQH